MKQPIAAFLIGATLIAGSAPYAFAGEGTGVIASVDLASRTVIMDDGTTWFASDGLDIEALMPGDAVNVVYEDGTTTLTDIQKAE
ncbi:MAG: DUF1344 domain-containing protein [Ahrensia sp.]